MANASRFRIRRTAEGGISIGYSALDTYLTCGRKSFWANWYGDHGIIPVSVGAPDFKLSYGKWWHALYLARFWEESEEEAFAEVVGEDALDAKDYSAEYDEVRRDLDWYWSQPREMQIRPLNTEDELIVPFGRHALRGTPDLVAEVEAGWGGGIYMFDHKTFVCVDRRNYVHVEPGDATINRLQHSRQLPYYMGLWNKAHPDEKCATERSGQGLLNLVPQRVSLALDILKGRRGAVRNPHVVREFMMPSVDTIDRTIQTALQACDEIAEALDSGAPLHAHAFKERWAACTNQYGSNCAYIQLCESPAKQWPVIVDGAYRSRA